MSGKYFTDGEHQNIIQDLSPALKLPCKQSGSNYPATVNIAKKSLGNFKGEEIENPFARKNPK